MNTEDKVRQAAVAINAAEALLVSAGAGMGVDSGLPDFRGTQGFWRAYPVIAKLGLSFEEMANPAWFRDDPALAWAFYGRRLNLYRNTVPHSGFSRLLEIGMAKPHGYFVFTSNVDGHFHKAGFAPERIVECHGSIHHSQCSVSCTDKIWDSDGDVVSLDAEKFRAREPLPRCRNCPALARPNILMFGDWSWLGAGGAIPTGFQPMCRCIWWVNPSAQELPPIWRRASQKRSLESPCSRLIIVWPLWVRHTCGFFR